MGYGKRVGGDSLGSHNRHFPSQTQVLCSVMTVMFGWVRISAIPSILGSSFLVMLLVLQMGLREFVHKLATECYQYLPLRPPPDPDSVPPPYMVSEGGPPQASEGVLSMDFMFHYLRPKLMVCNPWHLNERECGSSETEVVYLCRLLCYFSEFWSSQVFSTGHVVQFLMNGIQLFWHKQLSGLSVWCQLSLCNDQFQLC